MQPIIRAEGLGKRYRLGARGASYATLREAIVETVRRPFRPSTEDVSTTLWALKDVAFNVFQGDVVGIVGRNGAGKSTLLKILSRITEPTTGRVELHGRVGSLLEVGTGFHGELTGRENVYLNGAILGMRNAEITRKFDAIAAFAGVDRFLDTPVKRYSSGMFVRLAFAVAAHLETEILVVDEVLAVGDAEFQRKCLGKMSDVAREGRTVLFVSHNMAAVQALCTRCLLLSDGRVAADGSPAEVVPHYLALGPGVADGRVDARAHPGRRSTSQKVVTEIVLSSEGSPSGSIAMGSALSIEIAYRSPDPSITPVLGVVIKTREGLPLFGVNNRIIGGYTFPSTPAGRITMRFPAVTLMPGTYIVDVFFGDAREDIDIISDAIAFEVVQADVYGTGKLPPPMAGPLFAHATWTLRPGSPET